MSLTCALLLAWPALTWSGVSSAHAAPNVKSAHDAKEVAETAELVELARRRFREGQFEVAAKLFARCYELTGKPAMLFNVARAHEEGGQKVLAIQAFRDYVAVATDAAGKVEARAHIELLQDAMPRPAGPRPVKAVVSGKNGPEIAGSAAPPRSSRAAGWGLLIGGAAVGLVGGAVYASGMAADSMLHSDLARRDAAGNVIGVSRADALSRIDSIGNQETIGAILGAVGLAGVAASLALLLQDRPTQAGWMVTPAPTGVALSARF